MDNYDSRQDTWKHIRQVRKELSKFISALITRGNEHDLSKLESPEKEVFDKVTPKLRTLTYGSEKYKQSLAEMKPALDHHYASNSHHPEYYENGIKGMCLVDLVEMYCDWQAAVKRHQDGDMLKSIEINKERFKMGEVLTSIFRNTYLRNGSDTNQLPKHSSNDNTTL